MVDRKCVKSSPSRRLSFIASQLLNFTQPCGALTYTYYANPINPTFVIIGCIVNTKIMNVKIKFNFTESFHVSEQKKPCT